MHTSLAYSTPAPVDGSMTVESGAICGPVAARSMDGPDIASKGLLPQLIDVLHALTEGQELLSLKVRNARLGHSGQVTPITEVPPQPTRSDLTDSGTLLGSDPTALIGTLQGQPSTEIAELGAASTSTDGLGNGSLPEPIGVPAASMSGAVPAALTEPAVAPAAIVISSERHDLTDRLVDPQQTSDATGTSLNHDYNFFDELDSRLADLQRLTDPLDPEDRS